MSENNNNNITPETAEEKEAEGQSAEPQEKGRTKVKSSSGASPGDSPYYNRLFWASYKGHSRGLWGGIALGMLVGAAGGAILAVGLALGGFLAAGTSILSVLPLTMGLGAVGGALYMKDIFAMSGAVAGAVAASMEINEEIEEQKAKTKECDIGVNDKGTAEDIVVAKNSQETKTQSKDKAATEAKAEEEGERKNPSLLGRIISTPANILSIPIYRKGAGDTLSEEEAHLLSQRATGEQAYTGEERFTLIGDKHHKPEDRPLYFWSVGAAGASLGFMLGLGLDWIGGDFITQLGSAGEQLFGGGGGGAKTAADAASTATTGLLGKGAVSATIIGGTTLIGASYGINRHYFRNVVNVTNALYAGSLEEIGKQRTRQKARTQYKDESPENEVDILDKIDEATSKIDEIAEKASSKIEEVKTKYLGFPEEPDSKVSNIKREENTKQATSTKNYADAATIAKFRERLYQQDAIGNSDNITLH